MLTAILLVIWSLGLLVFVSMIPTSVSDTVTPCDAIVVLTGGRERLKTAVQLWRADRESWLFISGVFPNTPVAALFPEVATDEGALQKRLVVGRLAGDTVGNAVETAIWVREHNIRSIRLVTSAYHMPRSLIEFKAILPTGVRIIPNPVFSSTIAREGWWYHGGTLGLFAAEYSKYLVARVWQGLPDTGRSEAVSAPSASPSSGTAEER